MKEIREKIESSAMSPVQWLVVALCVFLNAQDGFDISAVAYASTGITNDWGLSGTELGAIISSGLVGIVVGAFVMSPLADWIGRRPCIVICLALTAVGMFAASAAAGPGSLTAWRFITGLGIGGVTASINVVVAEYTSPRWRGMSIGIYTAGFGVGATLGGLAAATLLDTQGWRSIFVIGGITSVVAIVLTLLILPESIAFLAQRRGAAALDQVNRILHRMRISPVRQITREVVQRGTENPLGQIAALFGRQLRSRTLLLWAGFFCSMFAFYFLSGWTPRLVVLGGHDASTAALIGSILAIGGSIGSVAFGLLSHRAGTIRLLLIFAALAALVFVGFGLSMDSVPVLLVLGFSAGLLANGVFVGLFTLAPELYSARIRGTGVGWANGVGRSGSVLAPIVVGVLVDRGLGAPVLYGLAAGLLVLLMVAVAAFRTLGLHHHSHAGETAVETETAQDAMP
ncbi:MFS transporter [Arthrobacter sp. JSM 101049]|uniref:MFS transporter n=1 Tax=Arthrobacter sp. JSM 101049 TaxID=929097 RepID=UPI003567B29C